uniref:Uncharacterized protein n=1 Tax=viral metagenome TaxID=1070528 RepID=A0A6H1ZKZ2_9ZZZZ
MGLSYYWKLRQRVEICHIEIKKKLDALVQAPPEDTTMEKLYDIVKLAAIRDQLEQRATLLINEDTY